MTMKLCKLFFTLFRLMQSVVLDPVYVYEVAAAFLGSALAKKITTTFS